MLYYKPITKDKDNPTGLSKPKLKAYNVHEPCVGQNFTSDWIKKVPTFQANHVA